MIFRYNKNLFTEAQIKFIDKEIRNNADKDILKLLTKVNIDNKPIYNVDQMLAISLGATRGLSLKQIESYAVLNLKGDPIYDANQMREIRESFLDELIDEQIDYLAVIDKNGKPVYDSDQMCVIRYGFNSAHITQKHIDIFSARKDGVPCFTGKEMRYINNNLLNIHDEESLNQLERCVRDGITFEELKPLINKNISADQIRILSSLYGLGFYEGYIRRLIELKTSYNDLKEIKYLLQYAKLRKLTFPYSVSNDYLNPKSIREDLIELTTINWNHLSTVNDIRYIIERAFTLKMPPEQIYYMCNYKKDVKLKEMMCIAICFLNGLTINDVEDAIKNTNLFNTKSESELEDIIKNIISSKIGKKHEDIDIIIN